MATEAGRRPDPHAMAARRRARVPRLYGCDSVYTEVVGKHLIDLDEKALSAARAELGTATIKDTVNEALRRATFLRERQVSAALDVLANARLDDRSEAWR